MVFLGTRKNDPCLHVQLYSDVSDPEISRRLTLNLFLHWEIGPSHSLGTRLDHLFQGLPPERWEKKGIRVQNLLKELWWV